MSWGGSLVNAFRSIGEDPQFSLDGPRDVDGIFREEWPDRFASLQPLHGEIVEYVRDAVMLRRPETDDALGMLFITNYRLVLHLNQGQSIEGCGGHEEETGEYANTGGVYSVPLISLRQVEKSEAIDPDTNIQTGLLNLYCNDIRYFQIHFNHTDDPETREAFHRCFSRLNRQQKLDDWTLHAFAWKTETQHLSSEWGIYKPLRELARMGVPDSKWRISSINNDYSFSPTYPSFFAVPSCVTDTELEAVGRFRSKQRIPVLSWRHPRTGCSMTRSSQPLVGMGQRHCVEDIKLIQSITLAMPQSDQMVIIDARPWQNAMAQKTLWQAGFEITSQYETALETTPEGELRIPVSGGGGDDNAASGANDSGSNSDAKDTERESIQPSSNSPRRNIRCTLVFMGIENIHVMRRSLSRIVLLCQTNADNDEKWLSQLGSSQWLEHCSSILDGASQIAEILTGQGASVLVHCSDGWDRTPQLTALAMLMLDPYYRTLRGFEVLVAKEWCSFGHKFRDRCGFKAGLESQEVSPVFLQWVDCVWQLWRQFPCAFEFNERFLVTIIYHVYSGRFGDFLYNCESERVLNGVPQQTPSLWAFIEAHVSSYRSPFYVGPSVDTCLSWSPLGRYGQQDDEQLAAAVASVTGQPPLAPESPLRSGEGAAGGAEGARIECPGREQASPTPDGTQLAPPEVAANRDEVEATEEEEAKAKRFFADSEAGGTDGGAGGVGSGKDADLDDEEMEASRPEQNRLDMSPLEEMIPHPPGMLMESMSTEQWEVVLPRLQISASVRSFAQVHGVTWFQVKVATNFEPLASWELAKRYSQFSELHRQLDDIHPFLIAPFPTKTLFSLGDDELEQRRGALHAFLRDVLRQPAIPAEAQVAALKFLGVYRRGLPEGTLLWPVPDATPPTAQEQLAWKQATANMTLEASIDAYDMLSDITWFEISVRTDFEPLGRWEVAKRYSQFSDLQEEIESVAGMLPLLKAPFPTKNLFSLTDDELEQRRGALHAFLCDLLLQPVIPATVQLALLDFLGVYRRGLPEGTLLWPVPTLTEEQLHVQQENESNLGRKLSQLLGIPNDPTPSSADGGSLAGGSTDDTDDDDVNGARADRADGHTKPNRGSSSPDQSWSESLLGVFSSDDKSQDGNSVAISVPNFSAGAGIADSPPPISDGSDTSKPSPGPSPLPIRGLRADIAQISGHSRGGHGEYHSRRSLPAQRFSTTRLHTSREEVRKTSASDIFRRVVGGGNQGRNQGQHHQHGEKNMSRMRRRKTSLLTMQIGDPGSLTKHPLSMLGAISESQDSEKEEAEPTEFQSPKRLSAAGGRRVSPAGLLNLSPRHSHRRVSNFSPPLVNPGEMSGPMLKATSGIGGGRRKTAIGASLPNWQSGKETRTDHLDRRSSSPGALGMIGSVVTRKIKIHVKGVAEDLEEIEENEDDGDGEEGGEGVHSGEVMGEEMKEGEAQKEGGEIAQDAGEGHGSVAEAAGMDDDKNKYEVLLPNCSVRSLQLWAGFFFRWEGPAEEFQFLRQVCTLMCHAYSHMPCLQN
jgi:myotubularin-related protein 1/2